MDLFVLCVAYLTVFVKCLVKQFAICLDVVVILLLNVMEVFSVGGGALLDRRSASSISLSSAAEYPFQSAFCMLKRLLNVVGCVTIAGVACEG